MKKAERLFHLVTLLRSRRTAMTAQVMAELMETSTRTVYRDVQALILAGVPIEGEPGIGYLIRPGYHLPPLMFTPDELQALLVGGRMVQAFTDRELAQAARRAVHKIKAVLPESLKQCAERLPYRVPVLDTDNPVRDVHMKLRRACELNQKVCAVYHNAGQVRTERVLWPLGLIRWTSCWTLLAWCELRHDYRSFRLDRFHSLKIMQENFTTTDEISVSHYLESVIGVLDEE